MARVVVLDQSCAAVDESASSLLQFVTLLHPHADKPAQYVVQGKTLQELQCAQNEYAAWFFNNSVIGDGNMYVGTVIDPLFVLLPLLEKNRKAKGADAGRFCGQEQMLMEDDQYPGYQCLMDFDLQLENICDAREIGGIGKVYRLNDALVVKWLRAKAEQIAEHISAASSNLSHIVNSVGVTGVASVATFKGSESNKRKRDIEDDALKVAVGLLSEYIAEQWLQQLCDHYQFQISWYKPRGLQMRSGAVPAIRNNTTTTTTIPAPTEKTMRFGQFEEDFIGVAGEVESENKKVGKAANPRAKSTASPAAKRHKPDPATRAITSFFPVMKKD